MDLNYCYYKDIMSYMTYIKKRDVWSLPFIYKWYIKFLYNKFWDWMSYTQFAYLYKGMGYIFIKRKVAYDSHKKQFKRFWDYNRYIISLEE